MERGASDSTTGVAAERGQISWFKQAPPLPGSLAPHLNLCRGPPPKLSAVGGEHAVLP